MPDLLTSSEVAAKFGVTTETVGTWADDGKLACIRTPGGHRRFNAADVDALLAASASPATDRAS